MKIFSGSQKIFKIIISLHLLGITAFSQVNHDYLRAGNKAYEKGDYYRAFVLYRYIVDSEKDYETMYKYAEACRLTHNYEQAAEYYAKIVRDSVKHYPLAQFRLAEMQKYQGKYQFAQINYKYFYDINKHKNDYYTIKAQHEIVSCEKAIEIKANPVKADITHLDTTVNTYFSDFAAYPSNDSVLFFSSMQPVGKDSSFVVNIYKTLKNNNKWRKSEQLDTLINRSDAHTANLVYGRNKNELYFTWTYGNNQNNETKILKSKFIDGKWTEPMELPQIINQPGKITTQPFIAKSGSKYYLLFVSDREEGSGQLDIWYSEILPDDSFGQVKNIGKERPDIDEELAYYYTIESKINSAGNEITPFYDERDTLLYFSSDWHYGLGGYDIFRIKGDFTRWSEPENLGYPVNTSRNDVYYKIDTIGGIAYLASNRKGSLAEKNEGCCHDLYSYKLPPRKRDTIKPKITEVVQKQIQIRELVPITLYFHNDEPNPRSTDTMTLVNYENSVIAYIGMLEEYKREYSKGLDENEKVLAIDRLDYFFGSEVKTGYDKLKNFTGLMKELLAKGQTIEVTLKGYASPLHNPEYNKKLAKRRIYSLLNYFRQYENELFVQYEQKKQLIFQEVAFGEDMAAHGVSDDLNDLRNSVYSPDAGHERKIQIIAVSIGLDN
ncbi:MAG: PD40 domain-containing protein [Bacteroidia bacterium]|nr:PD40 domain-containing protein [Bacteroidia bacterium]